MTELEKLLGFMSSWDRQATLDQYEAMFDEGGDPEKVMEELGSPTKVAVELAKNYVSTPSPGEAVSRDGPEIEVLSVSLEQLLAEEDAAAATGEDASASEPSPEDAPASEAEAPPAPPEEPEALFEADAPGAFDMPEAEDVPARRGAGGGALALHWIFAILIGIPVALALFCIGLPFLTAGAALIVAALSTVPGAFSSFALLSDILLLAGAGLALLAAGLLLAWFGLWLGLSLARLWAGGLILPLGRRLRYGEGARPRRGDTDVMAQVWKYAVIAVLVLLVGGVLLGGAGLLTGAEPERVWRYLNAGGHLDLVRSAAARAETMLRTVF